MSKRFFLDLSSSRRDAIELELPGALYIYTGLNGGRATEEVRYSMWAGDIKRPLANQVNGARGPSSPPRAGLICSTWRGIVREATARRVLVATRRRGDRRGGKREVACMAN